MHMVDLNFSNRLNDILQASEPIIEFRDSNNNLLSGEEIAKQKSIVNYGKDSNGNSFGLYDAQKGNDFVYDLIHNFKQKNQDNILANDAYEVYAYNTETYDRFYKAYDNNLALSHWNEIKSKYGDRLDEIWDKLEAYDSDALPQQHAESVLTVAGKAYIAQEKGLNEQCIDLMLEKFSYSNRDCDWFVQRSNDDSFEKQSSVNLNHNKTQIIIPSGLISGSKAGKYGSYAEVSVPLGNTFGKMTISDALVERNGRVTTLSLPDRNRNVSVYNKDTHSYNIVEYSVAELKELYDKNWEKLNSRNKNLDSKFESNQLNVYDSPQYE